MHVLIPTSAHECVPARTCVCMHARVRAYVCMLAGAQVFARNYVPARQPACLFACLPTCRCVRSMSLLQSCARACMCLCVGMYDCADACKHMRMHACDNVQVFLCVRLCAAHARARSFVCEHVHASVCVQTCTSACKYSKTHGCSHTQNRRKHIHMRTHTNTRTDTHACTHAHKRMCAHSRTHTHILMRVRTHT